MLLRTIFNLWKMIKGSLLLAYAQMNKFGFLPCSYSTTKHFSPFIMSIREIDIDLLASLSFIIWIQEIDIDLLASLSFIIWIQEIHVDLLAAGRNLHPTADWDQHRRDRRRRRPRQALGRLQTSPDARSPRRKCQSNPRRSMASATHRHRRDASH